MRSALIVVLMAFCLWSCGCTGCYKDITRRPEVQKSGIVGRCFISKKELVVVENRQLKIKELALPEYADQVGAVLGKFEVGGTLRIVRVERHCEGGAWWIPIALVQERTIPRGVVERGPFAGQKVGTSHAGLRVDILDEKFWAPCETTATTAPSKIPDAAIRGMP